MIKFIYTRTALASLLTLCSFSGFAADEEIKKPESNNTSLEILKTSNRKLKEKMDRICNTVPMKKAEEAKKKEEMKLTSEKNTKLGNKANDVAKAIGIKKDEKPKKNKSTNAKDSKIKDTKVKIKNIKTKLDNKVDDAAKAIGIKKDEKPKNKSINIKDPKIQDIKVENKNIKSVANKNIENDKVDTVFNTEIQRGLKITFGGVVDAQGYSKINSIDKRYNVMAGKLGDINIDQTSSTLSSQRISNIGDYSEDMGAVADAILHLRAENKNEDLGLIYGADLQFHVPVTKGKGISQSMNTVRGRGAHIFVHSEYGDVKLGYQFGPEALMRLDATRIATVDGAADSDWFRKVNLEGSSAMFPFHVTPRLYTESFSNESERLSFRMAGKYNKGIINALPFRVAYYSPNYMGARFAVSYAPSYKSDLFSENYIASTSTLPISLLNAAPAYEQKVKQIVSNFQELSKLIVPEDLTKEAFIKKISSLPQLENYVDTNYNLFDGNETSTIFKHLDIKVKQNEDSFKKYIKSLSEEYKADEEDVGSILRDKPDESFNTITPGGWESKPKPTTTKNGKALTISNTINLVDIDDFIKKINKKLDEERKRTVTVDESNIRNNVVEKLSRKILLSILDENSTSAPSLAKIVHIGPDYEHILSAGVSYEYDFNEYKLKVKASAVGEYGKPKQRNDDKYLYNNNEYVEYNDLMGINLGINADYKINEDQSIRFGASFAHLGKSGQPKLIKSFGGKLIQSDAIYSADNMHWTIGSGYQHENIYTSLTYFGSKMNDGDNLHNIALGVQYDLSPAGNKNKFVPYAALHYFTTEEKGIYSKQLSGDKEVLSNKGTLLVTGVKFSF